MWSEILKGGFVVPRIDYPGAYENPDDDADEDREELSEMRKGLDEGDEE